MSIKLKPISEDEFTDQVVELFATYGWKVVHFRKARKKDGRWMTPIKGHPGSPDILAARNGTKVFAELKVGRNKPTEDQAQWLHHLGDGAYLWYPCDWETIVMLASGGVR
jgi:hypothetical protein